MITYNPIDGDPYLKSIDYSPRTCFVMTKLGDPIPDEISEIRTKLTEKLNSLDIKEIDAASKVTGRDFLLKIWKQLLSVPLGIGIVDGSMTPQTMSNIFLRGWRITFLWKGITHYKNRGRKNPI